MKFCASYSFIISWSGMKETYFGKPVEQTASWSQFFIVCKGTNMSRSCTERQYNVPLSTATRINQILLSSSQSIADTRSSCLNQFRHSSMGEVLKLFWICNIWTMMLHELCLEIQWSSSVLPLISSWNRTGLGKKSQMEVCGVSGWCRTVLAEYLSLLVQTRDTSCAWLSPCGQRLQWLPHAISDDSVFQKWETGNSFGRRLLLWPQKM